MPRRSTKKWLTEGKTHIAAKQKVKELLKPYKIYCTEEELFPVDLHTVYPELWQAKSLRNYSADLVATRKKGHIIKRCIVEVDGGYHDDYEAKERDAMRDNAILQVHGLRVVRVRKEDVLDGNVDPDWLVEQLKI